MDKKFLSDDEWYLIEDARRRMHAIRLALIQQGDGGCDIEIDPNDMMITLADMLKDALKPIDDFCKRMA